VSRDPPLRILLWGVFSSDGQAEKDLYDAYSAGRSQQRKSSGESRWLEAKATAETRRQQDPFALVARPGLRYLSALFSASPVVVEGKLRCLSEDGEMYVVKTGTEYELLAKNSLNEVGMESPAVSDGRCSSGASSISIASQ